MSHIRDIDLRLTRDLRTLDIGSVLDSHAINQRLGMLIMTRVLDIPYEPTVGSLIGDIMFESTSVAKEIGEDIIRQVIDDHERRIEVETIRVHDENPHHLGIYIEYRIPPEQTIYEYEMKIRIQ